VSCPEENNGELMKTQNEYAGAKILVVEDSRTQAEYLRHILEIGGYEVALATNGKDALNQIRIDRPTIVLTDIIMPEMDGYALCSAIRQNANMAQIPVILVTQLFDPADLMKGLEVGANNIIIKPFEPEHVISRIISTLQALAHPDPDDAGASLEVSFDGQTHHIPASQLRTPTILLSSYDLAIRKNAELQESREHLSSIVEDLQRKVGELQIANENLLKENIERRRTEEDLAKENKKLQIMAGLTRDNLLNQLTAIHECLEQAGNIREEDSAKAWELIIKAELVVDQTIKTLR
jgi:DNA-binding response OmpR family regulator